MLSTPLPCNEAIDQLSRSLRAAGFQVERSFDLQSARSALRVPEACPCPHHGTTECSCQYVVLLVARDGSPPVSLIAHGQEQHTAFTIESSERAGIELILRRQIEDLALTS